MIDQKDNELLREAAAALSKAGEALKKVWERHTGVKTDAFGAVSSEVSDSDLLSSAPPEVQLSISAVAEATGLVNDLIGG